MSVTYQAVLWNRQKKIYDRVLALGVLLSIAAFVVVGAVLFPTVTAETLIIRSVGTVAFVLLLQMITFDDWATSMYDANEHLMRRNEHLIRPNEYLMST